MFWPYNDIPSRPHISPSSKHAFFFFLSVLARNHYQAVRHMATNNQPPTTCRPEDTQDLVHLYEANTDLLPGISKKVTQLLAPFKPFMRDCPVCERGFKNERGLLVHLGKSNCGPKLRSIRDTMAEETPTYEAMPNPEDDSSPTDSVLQHLLDHPLPPIPSSIPDTPTSLQNPNGYLSPQTKTPAPVPQVKPAPQT